MNILHEWLEYYSSIIKLLTMYIFTQKPGMFLHLRCFNVFLLLQLKYNCNLITMTYQINSIFFNYNDK